MEPAKVDVRRIRWRLALRVLAMLGYLLLAALLVVRLREDAYAFVMFAGAMSVGLGVERQLGGPGYIGAALGAMLGAALGDGRFSFSLLDGLDLRGRGWAAGTAAACGAILALPYAWIWRRLDPNWGKVVAAKAQRTLERGHADGALAQYTYAIETNAGDPVHYNNRGLAYLRLGRHAEAMQDFTDAIAINPRLAAAYCNRAMSLLHLGETQRALDDLAAAVEREPQNGSVHQQRGAVFMQIGDPRQALDAYSQAIALDPSLAQAYFERAALLARQNQHLAAIDDLNRALWIIPDFARAFHLRGQVQVAQRNLTAAIQDFGSAIRLDPANAEFYRSRAAAYQAASYFAESRADLDRAEQLGA